MTDTKSPAGQTTEAEPLFYDDLRAFLTDLIPVLADFAWFNAEALALLHDAKRLKEEIS